MKLSNLAVRLLTAGVAVPVVLWLLYLAPWWGFLSLVAVSVAIASAELMRMAARGAPVLQAWGILASLGLMAAFRFAPDAHLLMVAILGIVVAGLLAGLTRPLPHSESGPRMAWLVAGPLYIGGLGSTVALLHTQSHGAGWVVLSMMFAFLSDTGAYFAGRFLGKHKLYPSVSPKKTVEGAFGGLAGSVAGALLAHFWYLPCLPLVQGIVLAMVAGALGQSGDLVASLIKRSTDTKDSGWILPGHGGMLDRIDALLFTAAATWVYVSWVF